MTLALSSAVVVRVAVLGAIVTGAASRPFGEPMQGRRTAWASAIDKNGTAVTDLQAADFEVKVAGKTQNVVSVEPSATPLRIALLVADGGTGAFQLGLAHFMQTLLGHAEFKLVSVLVQPETVVDFSTDGGALSGALNRLGPRGRQRGAQLMEAIQDATKDIRQEPKRGVIVVLRIGGEGPTELAGDDVREQLRKSGAILHVVSTSGAQRAAPSQIRGTDAISVQQGQLHDAELQDAANNLQQVLGDGSRESGGRHGQILSTSLAGSLKQLGEELLHLYQVTYTVPDTLKPNDKLSVSSKRKGVTISAPSRIPG